jgi:hypothetical protein
MTKQSSTEGSRFFKAYFVRLLLFSIPVVNLGATMVWLFAGTDDETKAFGKASLLVVLLVTAICVAIGVLSYGYLSSVLLRGPS